MLPNKQNIGILYKLFIFSNHTWSRIKLVKPDTIIRIPRMMKIESFMFVL